MNELPMSQAENHAFNTVFAAMYGVHEAIIIAHFQSWINHNKRLGRNFKDGRTWCYQTRKEIAAWFPYFSEKQVRKITDKLEKLGVLKKGNYNKCGFDKTIWYAFENEEIFTTAHLGNGGDQTGNGGDQTGKPIPYPKTSPKPSSKKHICPDGGDALSKMNEMGYVEYLPPMRGKLKNDYTDLNADQKRAFSLLVSVPPVSEDDQRVNPVTAVNVVRNYSIDAIRKAILFYQQKLEEGLHPKNTGALILDFLGKRLEPLPPQASTNKSFWEKHKHHYPPGSYEEHQRCIVVKRIDRELSFAMSHDVFVEQFKRNLEMYKDQ